MLGGDHRTAPGGDPHIDGRVRLEMLASVSGPDSERVAGDTNAVLDGGTHIGLGFELSLDHSVGGSNDARGYVHTLRAEGHQHIVTLLHLWRERRRQRHEAQIHPTGALISKDLHDLTV